LEIRNWQNFSKDKKKEEEEEQGHRDKAARRRNSRLHFEFQKDPGFGLGHSSRFTQFSVLCTRIWCRHVKLRSNRANKQKQHRIKERGMCEIKEIPKMEKYLRKVKP